MKRSEQWNSSLENPGSSLVDHLLQKELKWEWASTPNPPYKVQWEGEVLTVIFDDDSDCYSDGILEYILCVDGHVIGRVAQWPSAWKRPRGKPPFWDRGKLGWYLYKFRLAWDYVRHHP